MKKLKILVANPSGNITIFVLTPCEQSEYQNIARKLLAHKELKGEQVGFIKSIGQKNVLEMAGMEFCGNAGRAFALYCAKAQNIMEPTDIVIRETGTDKVLHVNVNPQTNYTNIKMPDPVRIEPWTIPDLHLDKEPILVDLGGIIHIVLRDVEPSEEIFAIVKKAIYAKKYPAALGTIFFDTKTYAMVPIVYAQAVNTTYWEGSCGSGSQATALALSWLNRAANGSFGFKLKQPAGTIIARVEKNGGKILASYIEGHVELSKPQEIEI